MRQRHIRSAVLAICGVLLVATAAMAGEPPGKLTVVSADRLDKEAWAYHHGTGGKPQDFERARQLFEAALAAGFEPAHYGLATLYSRGQGVDIDYPKAIRHFEQAALAGMERAIFNLGVLYHYGLGVEQDDVRARAYFELAAAQGLDHAWFSLGVFDQYGLGGPADHDKALDWYRKAARAGLPKAQAKLREMGEDW